MIRFWMKQIHQKGYNMEISDYLAENKISIVKFAEMLHYTPAYLGQVFGGKIKAGRKLIEDIQNATKGKITGNDLQEKYASTNFERLLF